MARKIELRHHPNAPLPRIRNQSANLILRVVKPIRTHLVQFRKLSALHPKALIFRKMPVKYVHLHDFHAINVPAQYFQRNKMSPRIDHQSTPRKARRVLDSYSRRGKSVWRYANELQKSLQPMQCAKVRRRSNTRFSRHYFEDVGFVFAQFLNRLTFMLNAHQQRDSPSNLQTEWRQQKASLLP